MNGDSSASPKRRPTGLGRGLNALLGEVAQEVPVSAPAQGVAEPDERSVRLIAIASILPNPDQPRKFFAESALDDLARSIETRGLVQPIVVRPFEGKYQIVAGERRWRAAQRAHLHQIPAIVREFNYKQALEIALIENIQREDLNAIEEAEAYQKLIDEFAHNHDQLGKLVNKSRSHVANLLRLLELPPLVRDMVAEGKLSMGHARALLGVPNIEMVAQQVIAKGLSVRDTERLARSEKKPAERASGSTRGIDPSVRADLEALERQLGDLLGLKVKVSHDGKGGQVALHYRTLDQLDMICQRLTGDSL